MQFRIIAEGHEGVVSCDEECLGIIEAENETLAIKKLQESNSNIRWVESWKCFTYGAARKIYAEKI